MREKLVQEVRIVVDRCFKGEREVIIFGSLGTGLLLPSSDIDVVVSSCCRVHPRAVSASAAALFLPPPPMRWPTAVPASSLAAPSASSRPPSTPPGASTSCNLVAVLLGCELGPDPHRQVLPRPRSSVHGTSKLRPNPTGPTPRSEVDSWTECPHFDLFRSCLSSFWPAGASTSPTRAELAAFASRR